MKASDQNLSGKNAKEKVEKIKIGSLLATGLGREISVITDNQLFPYVLFNQYQHRTANYRNIQVGKFIKIVFDIGQCQWLDLEN